MTVITSSSNLYYLCEKQLAEEKKETTTRITMEIKSESKEIHG